MNDTDKQLLKTAYNAIEDKLGQDISILDITNISTLSNYFIIATGNNPNQVKAIAENLEMELSKIDVKLIQSEGYQHSNWILLDFNDIIVHVFDKENREFYNLERVWSDAQKVDAESI